MNDWFSANGWLNTTLAAAGDAIWTYFLIGALIVCALWYTFSSKGVQFRSQKEMFRVLGHSGISDRDNGKRISAFQAFAVSMATRVGTGNLAGVATAITIGGPGAVFWMWIMAIFGSSLSFVESTLAQIFKKKEKESFIGGPAYYIRKGLGNKWLAGIFAVLIIVNFGMANNSIQANTICSAMEGAFGIKPLIAGIILAAISMVVIFGGIHRISKVSSVIVPIMALGYLLLALYIIFSHLGLIPQVFGIIFKDAFGISQIAGGGIGVTVMTGIRRGLFSNEAGEGSVPNVAATADVSHPVKQGLIQALGVFVDTLVVCSCTAFIILFSGVDITSGVSGIKLTQSALAAEIGSLGPLFITIAVFLFAYSTIIGNYYYMEANIRYLTSNKTVLVLGRILSGGVFVIFGGIASLDLVWTIGDLCMALQTTVNLIAIVLLGKYALTALKDYNAQKKRGVTEPEFHRSTLPDADLGCWD